MTLRAWHRAWVRVRSSYGATLAELTAYLAVIAVLTLAIALGLLDVYRTGAGAVTAQAARSRVAEATAILTAAVQAQAPDRPALAPCAAYGYTDPSAVCLWDAAGPPQGQIGRGGGGRGGDQGRAARDRGRHPGVPLRLVVVEAAPLRSCPPPRGMYGATLAIAVLPHGSAGAVARYAFAVATPAPPTAPDAGGAFVPWPNGNGGRPRLIRIFLAACGTSTAFTVAAVAAPATIGWSQGGG